MFWSELDYNWTVKNHLVYNTVIDIVQRDVEKKYKCNFVAIKPLQELRLDPGGMIFLNYTPLKFEISDGGIISVRPELLLAALYTWTKHRVLEERMPNGEKVIKAYCNSSAVVVIPESIYNKVGAWLALNKSAGQVARMELMEALSGHSNILITPFKSEGES